MLISRSKLNVKDNSGSLVAQCIQVQRSKKSQKPCRIGDFLKATIKKGSSFPSVTRFSKGLKKLPAGFQSLKRVVSQVVIQTKADIRRLDGSAIRFNANCGVTVNERQLPIFKRVLTVVPFELKKSCSSVLALSKNRI